jgi:tRNA (guanine9-N1)-methyltransferase
VSRNALMSEATGAEPAANEQSIPPADTRAPAPRVAIRCVAHSAISCRLALYVAGAREPRRQRRGRAALAAAASSATLAFDLGSFCGAMSGGEMAALAKQLALCYGANRRLERPFRLSLCGLGAAAPVAAALETHGWVNWVVAREERPPWLAFPRERVVYLTADAEEPLLDVQPDDVLIIGGLVDYENCEARVGEALRLARAHGLRTARLPLDAHVAVRKTSLTCHAVVQILAGFTTCRDWGRAVREAPAMHQAPLKKYVTWKKPKAQVPVEPNE